MRRLSKASKTKLRIFPLLVGGLFPYKTCGQGPEMYILVHATEFEQVTNGFDWFEVPGNHDVNPGSRVSTGRCYRTVP